MTGCPYLDIILGELEQDVITTIYGPGGVGKTCTCMLLALKVLKAGGKVLYIDTEGGFSVERFKQVAGENYESLLQQIIFLHPTTFEAQKKCFETLKDQITPEIKLVIVDTIAMLYRLELGKHEEVYETSRELGRQISLLTDIARTHHIPVVLTNQVYTNLDNGKNRMVGGDILVYGSKCLVELTKEASKRTAILRKHRSKKEGKLVPFILVQQGIECSSQ